jgi:hypothetical protein
MRDKSIAHILKSDFEKRNALNPRYSLRAYANYLCLNVGVLSEIMSGNRKATPHYIDLVSAKLGLSLVETVQIKVYEELSQFFCPEDAARDSASIHLSPQEEEFIVYMTQLFIEQVRFKYCHVRTQMIKIKEYG